MDDLAKKIRSEIQERVNPTPKDDRTGQCVVCDGTVIARVTREYRGDPMQRIIGPGSMRQMSTVHHGFHCEKCGLRYKFPPPKDLVLRAPEGI